MFHDDIPRCNFRRCVHSCKLHSQEQILLLWLDASHEGDTPETDIYTMIQCHHVLYLLIHSSCFGPHWALRQLSLGNICHPLEVVVAALR